MPFNDTTEGTTHFENDGCGEPEHNQTNESWIEALQVEVMEDYIMDAEGMSPGESKAQYMRQHFEKLVAFIANERKTAQEEAIKECIDLSDKIELAHETAFDEWRGFKHFRNAMRDKLKTLGLTIN